MFAYMSTYTTVSFNTCHFCAKLTWQLDRSYLFLNICIGQGSLTRLHPHMCLHACVLCWLKCALCNRFRTSTAQKIVFCASNGHQLEDIAGICRSGNSVSTSGFAKRQHVLLVYIFSSANVTSNNWCLSIWFAFSSIQDVCYLTR